MPHETWGTSSDPHKAATELGLDRHLAAAVPENGIVVDIGAGIGLSLAAAIHVRRADIRVMSVDSSFRFDWPPMDLDVTIAKFPRSEQAALSGTDAWHRRRVVGYAEALPIATESAHMAISYSAVPIYTSVEASLAEAHRVLQVGGLAVLGPIPDAGFGYWDRTVKLALEAGLFSAYEDSAQVIETWHGPVDAHITTLTGKNPVPSEFWRHA